MRCDIPPSVQFSQVLEARRIRWIGRRQMQSESEAVEVFSQVLQVGVALIEGAMGGELVLDEELKAGAHSRDNDLGRFAVKVAAEPLKVSAQEHDVAAQILFAKWSIEWSERQGSSALSLDFHQTRHAIVHPMLQRGGWHDLLRGTGGFLQRSTLPILILNLRRALTPIGSRWN
jgi:hypothetical protein